MAAGEAPAKALDLLSATPAEIAVDTGYVLERQMLWSLCELLANHPAESARSADEALVSARKRGARRVQTRLRLICAMALHYESQFVEALSEAAHAGDGGILTTVYAIGRHLWLAPSIPTEVISSVQKWPQRWLPVLRRQLNDGGTANAFVAARLLDEYGDASDLIRLRAFGKTYRKQSRSVAGLGTQLARRVAPVVHVQDLGRSELVIADRIVTIASIRRKVCRPAYVPGHATGT